MQRLHGLDLLRGLAALIVLVMHVVGFRGGHLAVDFFFMLSGFVMARTYDRRLRDGGIAPLRFLAMRFWRLWPVMAIGALLGLIVAIAASGPSADLLLPLLFALLLLPGSASVPYLLNLPAWSIFYELLANALHGAVFARLSTGMLAGLLLLLIAGFAASLALAGFPRILQETTIGMQVLVVVRALVSYLIGLVAFRLVGEQSPVKLPLYLGMLALPAYIAFVSLVDFPLWPLPFVLVIAPLVLLSGLDPRAPPGLSHVLGTISFPLYAIHYPILSAAAMAGMTPHDAMILCLGAASLWLLPDAAARLRSQARAAPAT